MPKSKFSDGSWYPPIFDICNCKQLDCNETVWGGKKYIDGHSNIGKKRPKQSEFMKFHNPMKISEIADKFRGDLNPMKRPEVRAKFEGELNPAKRPEVRQKLVDMWKDQELRERACKNNSESWTQEKKENYSKQMKENNPMNNEEIKAKHLETVNTIEYRTKMSKSVEESWITNLKIKNCGKNSYFYGKTPHHGKVYIYKSPFQGEIKLNGSYEYNYVIYLDIHNIKWYYEPQAFPLILNNKDTTYTPDFYLLETDEYIEVKGRWRDDSKEKYELFIKTYPNIKIILLMKQDLKNLGIRL